MVLHKAQKVNLALAENKENPTMFIHDHSSFPVIVTHKKSLRISAQDFALMWRPLTASFELSSDIPRKQMERGTVVLWNRWQGELLPMELNKTRNREVTIKSSERNKVRFIMPNRVTAGGIGPVVSFWRCVAGLSAASEGVASVGESCAVLEAVQESLSAEVGWHTGCTVFPPRRTCFL